MGEPNASTRARDDTPGQAADKQRPGSEGLKAVGPAEASKPDPQPSAFDLYKSARLGLSTRATLDDLWNCYRLFLRREPDPTGFNSRAKLVQKGVTIAELTKPFIASREFGTLDQRKSESKTVRAQLDGLEFYTPAVAATPGQTANGQAGASRPHLRGMIASLLTPGQFILDIGAGIGEFAIPAARKIGPKGRIVALEPAPRLMRLLLANSLSHELANIDVLPFAAADGDGFVSLVQRGAILTSTDVSHADLIGDAETPVAYARTIDSIVPPSQKIDLVRIMVDGFEFRALSGAIATLKAHRPPIIGEYAPKLIEQYSGVAGGTYLRFLRDCGYARFTAVPRRGGGIDLGGDIAKLAELPAHLGIASIDFLAE